MPTTRITNFAEFYPYYLTQHANRICRRAHFIGTTAAIGAMVAAIESGNAWYLLAAVVLGYGGAWVGHFFFEKNRPASFTQPLYSFRADWLMYWDMLRGKLSW
jgi:hypothetical protein